METREEGMETLSEVPPAKRLCTQSDEPLQATANLPAVTVATDGSDQNTCGSNERVHPVAVEDADTSSFQEFRSDNIVDHLSYLFTCLQNSRHKWLTPTHLVDFLGLEYQEQQVGGGACGGGACAGGIAFLSTPFLPLSVHLSISSLCPCIYLFISSLPLPPSLHMPRTYKNSGSSS